MELFFGIIFFAIITERLVTYINTFFVESKFQFKMLSAIILGVGVSMAYKLDLLVLFGIETTVPYVSYILTGILISGGSNYVYDLIGKFTNIKKVE